MKQKTLCISLLMVAISIHGTEEKLSINITPTWKKLQKNHKKTKQFANQAILIGSITFKKRSNKHIWLDKLTLTWHGPHINNLFGSLYKKSPNDGFLLIEDYLICDGIWQTKQQKLILPFNHHHTLSAVETYYLVLIMPQNIEHSIRSGKFTLDHSAFPEMLQPYISEQRLSLDIGMIKELD